MQGFHQAKASSHEGDIPVEELMKIQKKLQNQQKKKSSKEPQFVDWENAKYPGQTKSSNKGNEEWGDFVGGDFKFPEGQQDQGNAAQNNNFDAFGYFNGDDGQPAAAKQDDQSWGAFEFGGTTTNVANTTTEQTSNANAGWTGDLWDAPQFDTKKEAEKPSNTTADNFDFFGDFSSGNDQKN